MSHRDASTASGSRAAKSEPPEVAFDFRTLVENTNDIPYVATTEGKLVYFGEQFERYGYSADEVIESGVMAVIVPEDRERVAKELELSMTTGEEFPTTFRIATSDGEVRWLEDHGRVHRDESGRIVGLIGVLRDITARKRAEQALQESEERFRRLAEQSADPMFVIDISTRRLSFTSPSIERVTGYSSEELAGLDPVDLPTMPDPDRIAEGYDLLQRNGEVEGFELPFTHKDGSKRLVEVNAVLVSRQDEGDQIQGIARDVTHRRAFEERLRQQQKMEALGTLAGGIAHDFNNLLTGILGGASLLKQCADDRDRITRTADVIERAAMRASELTQRLLGFARPGKHNTSAVNLHRVVEDVVALLSRTLDRKVEIVQHLKAYPSLVIGDAALLQQVVLNLAVNASDAMPSGGCIRFESESVEIDDARGQLLSALERGSYVALRVSDTGIGMSSDIVRRIYEPFFTTKEERGRSGLGLATVYGIVTSHAGSIQVKSEPGEGTTFEVYLPRAGGEELRVVECSGGLTAGRGRLLVVDDEEVVREAASVILPELGYEVICARDGREAVELYTDKWGSIDLVIIDLSMPVMGGAECFRSLRQLNPEVRALLSTGHAFDDEAQALLDEGILGFIQKPFTMRQLADKVSEALF